MFGKRCRNCDKKISRGFEFCPYCGKSTESDNYGMLGKDDVIKSNAKEPFESILGGSMFNKMFSSAVKMLEKEMAREMKSMNRTERQPGSQFELYINGKKINLENNPQKIIKQEPQKIPSPPPEIIEKAKKLPRKEAKTELKRLGSKITYEIKVPGIYSLDHVLVTKLEDSIEVKAFSSNCVYIKTLPIKLALMKYYLKDEILSLEFQGK